MTIHPVADVFSLDPRRACAGQRKGRRNRSHYLWARAVNAGSGDATGKVLMQSLLSDKDCQYSFPYTPLYLTDLFARNFSCAN